MPPSDLTAKCIQLAMIKGGLSGEKLAHKMEVTPTTVSRWRTTGCNSLTALEGIAKHCGMTVQDLMALDN